MIVKQPNGYYARFSSIVDNFTHINLTKEEAFDLCQDNVGRNEAKNKIQRADSDANPRSHQPRQGNGLQRWNECLERILMQHGEEEKAEVEKLDSEWEE